MRSYRRGNRGRFLCSSSHRTFHSGPCEIRASHHNEKGHRPTTLLPKRRQSPLAEGFPAAKCVRAGARPNRVWATVRAFKTEGRRFHVSLHPSKDNRGRDTSSTSHMDFGKIRFKPETTAQAGKGPPAKRAFRRARQLWAQSDSVPGAHGVRFCSPPHPSGGFAAASRFPRETSSEARAPGMHPFPTMHSAGVVLHALTQPSSPIRRPLSDGRFEGRSRFPPQDIPTRQRKRVGKHIPWDPPLCTCTRISGISLVSCTLAQKKSFAFNVLSITPTRSKRVAGTAPNERRNSLDI